MTDFPPEGASLRVLGRLVEASNATFLCELVGADGTELGHAVYKPTAGEAPLWDFPRHTLGRREVAAYDLSEAAGFGVVPQTTWIEDGPVGPGSLQRWVEADDEELVTLVLRDGAPAGWFPIVAGVDESERPVLLVHADEPGLRRLALFDVLTANADRKGAHVLVSGGRVFGVDHGVCFHTEDKLRTVLWGWAGSPLTDDEVSLVTRAADVASDVLDAWLLPSEVAAVVDRSTALLTAGAFPEPGDRWPVIPWPPL